MWKQSIYGMVEFRKWKFSTNFLMLIFSLLVYLAWQSEAINKQIIDNLSEESKKQPPKLLTCHVCHSETNQGCLNMTDLGDDFDGFKSECETTEFKHCVVKKFAFTYTENGTTTPMKTFSLKRNCSKLCEKGCVVMGERTRLYVCSSCCETDNCNMGSGSGSVHQPNKSFQYFLTSVGNVHFYMGKLRHLWHILEMTSLLLFQLVI